VKRKRLAELVREEAGDLQEAPAPREERPGEAPHGGGLEGSSQEKASTPPEEKPSADKSSIPPYLTYIRKECRFAAEELNQLTLALRRLKLDIKKRQRWGRKERFTENTLIRWSVRLFLTLLPDFREHIISDPGSFGSQLTKRDFILEILHKNDENSGSKGA